MYVYVCFVDDGRKRFMYIYIYIYIYMYIYVYMYVRCYIGPRRDFRAAMCVFGSMTLNSVVINDVSW